MHVPADHPDLSPLSIALCTFNGAAHLDEQLASYEAQTCQNWTLWVSDDGSTDETRAIIARWAARWRGRNEVHVVTGPQLGSASANFMHLLCHPQFPDGHVAVSDQDDVWHPHKLARARSVLKRFPPESPVLYGAKSVHTDAELNPTGNSSSHSKRPTFGNAIAQNIVSGHSMVISAAAMRITRSAGIPADIAYHDWWLYLLLSGAGAEVVIDDQVVLSYRQHRNNVMGAHQGLWATLTRLKALFDGTYGRWLDMNLTALEACAALLAPAPRKTLEDLRQDVRKFGYLRRSTLKRAGIHRQNNMDHCAVMLAAQFRRLKP